MFVQDDRTPEQMKIPHLIVMMTDAFMSGWGEAEGGPSYAGWAVTEGYVNSVESRVRNRSDARRVRIVLSTYRPPSGPGHCHIYASDMPKATEGQQ